MPPPRSKPQSSCTWTLSWPLPPSLHARPPLRKKSFNDVDPSALHWSLCSSQGPGAAGDLGPPGSPILPFLHAPASLCPPARLCLRGAPHLGHSPRIPNTCCSFSVFRPPSPLMHHWTVTSQCSPASQCPVPAAALCPSPALQPELPLYCPKLSPLPHPWPDLACGTFRSFHSI